MNNLYAWKADGSRNGTVLAGDKKEAAEIVKNKFGEKVIEVILLKGSRMYEGDVE